jgi:hypothetical protein
MSQYSYPVIEDDKIPAPKIINTPHDFERLFLHVITHFYDEIKACAMRTRLLISIRSILTPFRNKSDKLLSVFIITTYFSQKYN